MSKSKNREVYAHADAHDVAEAALVRSDLLRITLLNVLYLALVLAVYYADAKNNFLLNFFTGIFRW